MAGDSRARGLSDVGPRTPQRDEMQPRNLDPVAIIKESCVFSVCNPDPLPWLVGDNGVISGDRDFRSKRSVHLASKSS